VVPVKAAPGCAQRNHAQPPKRGPRVLWRAHRR